MTKKQAVICDCDFCKQIADTYGLPQRNWYVDITTPSDVAVIPAWENLSGDTIDHLFAIFSIPDHFEYIEYPLPPEHYQQSFACKIVDTVEKYHCSELIVRQFNDYYFCRLAHYQKWDDGVPDRYEFIEWDAEKEAALPNHLEWVLDMSLGKGQVSPETLSTLWSR